MAEKDDWGYWHGLAFGIGGMALTRLLLIGFGWEETVRDHQRKWREWSCAQSGAVLAADTLCIRPDTSYRVAEPK